MNNNNINVLNAISEYWDLIDNYKITNLNKTPS